MDQERFTYFKLNEIINEMRGVMRRLNCYGSRNILLQKLNNYTPIQLIMA